MGNLSNFRDLTRLKEKLGFEGEMNIFEALSLQCRNCKFFEEELWVCDYDADPPEAIPEVPCDMCTHPLGFKEHFAKTLEEIEAIEVCPYWERIES